MKRPFVISFLCLLGAFALLVWGFAPQPMQQATDEKRYVLLMESDTGTFVMQLRKGMQEAAALQGAQLAVQIVQPEQMEVQAAALAEDAPAAVLLLLTDPQPMMDRLADAKIPAIVVGQLLPGYACVASDDEKAGAELTARALALAEPTGVLWLSDESDARANARVQGAQKAFANQEFSVLPWQEGMAVPTEYSVVIASSSRVTRALADAKAEGILSGAGRVLGVDTGDSRVRDLERGWVSVMAMDSPYAMGYLAVEKCHLLADNPQAEGSHACEVTLIDSENMYGSENVKMVFPLLQ